MESISGAQAHWKIIDSFGHGLTLEKLAAVDFNQIVASICVLLEVDAGQTPPIEAMQESFMDLAHDCMALQSMQERLKDSFLGRPIQRGGPTTLDRFKQRWQSVITELASGKEGAPIREYLGMLGKGLDPMTEDSGLHIEASTSEGAGSKGAGSKDVDPESDDSESDASENHGSGDDNSEDSGSEDLDINTQESLSPRSLSQNFLDLSESPKSLRSLLNSTISESDGNSDDSGSEDVDVQESDSGASDTITRESLSPRSLSSRDSRCSSEYSDIFVPSVSFHSFTRHGDNSRRLAPPIAPTSSPSFKRKRDYIDDTDDEYLY